MKTVLLISVILLSASCASVRERQKLKYQSKVVENHYRDSVHTFERETIREQLIKSDSTLARFNLDSLIKAGTLRSSDRYFTTEIRYQDNNLIVTTTIDSLMSRIRMLERSFSSTHVSDQRIEDVSKVLSERKSTSFSGWIFVGIGLIFVILVYLYWRMEEHIKSRSTSK